MRDRIGTVSEQTAYDRVLVDASCDGSGHESPATTASPCGSSGHTVGAVPPDRAPDRNIRNRRAGAPCVVCGAPTPRRRMLACSPGCKAVQYSTPDRTAERFWAKVNRDGRIVPYVGTPCWEWVGAHVPHGYGLLKADGRFRLAHRLSWAMANGPIPEGLFVCHHCDNPACIRPDHLFLGTGAENVADRVRKGRTKAPVLPPEKRMRGDQHWTRLHPEWVPRGDNHAARLRPETRARGERSGRAVLTEEKVAIIRARRRAGETYASIAAEFGVSLGAVRGAAIGLNWRHVPDPPEASS